MNRELKFRAWDTNLEQWVDFNFVSDIKIRPIPDDSSDSTLSFEPLYAYGYILDQYTGFKDRNGAAIYEGDILRITTSNPLCPVEYQRGSFCLRMDDYYIELRALSKPERLVEVVGNVHENPELLESTT